MIETRTIVAASGTGESPASQTAIDFRHLRKFTLGDRDLELEVLTLFVDQCPIYMGQLADASTQQAWKEAAHALKGSAMAIGAHRVADAAAAAEKSVTWQQDPEREAHLHALGQALAGVQAAVRAFADCPVPA